MLDHSRRAPGVSRRASRWATSAPRRAFNGHKPAQTLSRRDSARPGYVVDHVTGRASEIHPSFAAPTDPASSPTRRLTPSPFLPRRPTPAGRTRARVPRVPHPARPRAVPGGPTSTCTSSRGTRSRSKTARRCSRRSARRRRARAATRMPRASSRRTPSSSRTRRRWRRRTARPPGTSASSRLCTRSLPGSTRRLRGKKPKKRKPPRARRRGGARGAEETAARVAAGLPPLSAEEIARRKKRKMRRDADGRNVAAADAFPELAGAPRVAPRGGGGDADGGRRPASRRADSGHAVSPLRRLRARQRRPRVPHARAQPERCVPRENRGPAGAHARARALASSREFQLTRARTPRGARPRGAAWTRRRRTSSSCSGTTRTATSSASGTSRTTRGRCRPRASFRRREGRRRRRGRGRSPRFASAGGAAPTDSRVQGQGEGGSSRGGCRGGGVFAWSGCCVRGDARRSQGEAGEEGEEGQGEATTARLSARGKNPSSPGAFRSNV